MHSGKKVVLILALVVLTGVIAALSIWKTKTEEGNRRAAEELTARYEARIDSLESAVDSLRLRAQVQSGGSDTMFIQGMMRQIDTLRTQVLRVAESSRRLSGVDSVNFYLARLGDSTFFSYYGDYQEPKRWYIAPEWFGTVGLPGIAPLIHHLDSAQGFALEQTLYALLLASQHESVTAITNGELPRDVGNGEVSQRAADAWRRWARRWNLVE